MSNIKAEVVICGAGIAGISAAYHLSVKQGIRDILLIDQGAPLSLTSDKSTECYRNWWPGPGNAMVSLMNRSIDILESLARESGNTFRMNRRGYVYATAESSRIPDMRSAGEEAAALGAGALRCHPGKETYAPVEPNGFEGQPVGSDLLLEPSLIHEHFPYLSDNTIAVLHARRCGWLSAQTLGMYMLDQARECGVKFVSTRIVGVDLEAGGVKGIHLGNGDYVHCSSFVIAAGPLLKQIGEMLAVELPVFCELHSKVSFRDEGGVFPRSAPLLIWTDPQFIEWSDEERRLFAESAESFKLLNSFPSGVHARTEGGTFLALWTYHMEHVEPVFPIRFDPHYPEIALRGLATMLPALRIYFDRLPRHFVDGGYYCKTEENRPLIGPLSVRGAYVVGALSGFGIMAACAAGELVAAHLTGGALPHYAPAFLLERYQDPTYRQLLSEWTSSGQL